MTLIREQLAELYQQQEDWSKAAQALAGIDLDSGMRVLGAEYKLSKNIQIAMLYLEVGAHARARCSVRASRPGRSAIQQREGRGNRDSPLASSPCP